MVTMAMLDGYVTKERMLTSLREKGFPSERWDSRRHFFRDKPKLNYSEEMYEQVSILGPYGDGSLHVRFRYGFFPSQSFEADFTADGKPVGPTAELIQEKLFK